MAWIAVDKNEDEYIFVCKPHRAENEWYETCDFIELPKGMIIINQVIRINLVND